MAKLMQLKVILPHQIYLEQSGVKRIVVETRQGFFGLLPRRLDCTATLAPGIFAYETAAEGEKYLALDTGVLVKCGPEVLVAVRRAISGPDLKTLREAVNLQFLRVDEQERNVRLALARLESDFIRRFLELQRHG